MDSYTRTTDAILAPVLAFLCLMLCIPPMIWHASNRNWGASFLVAFAMYEDATVFINALIWSTTDFDSWWDGAVYCDIQVKLNIASQVGLPGALVCIFRSLALVMDVNKSALVPSRGERMRNRIVNVMFCIGLPILAMLGHFCFQQDRYYIIAVGGCNPTMDESWPTVVFLTTIVIICLVAAIYCLLVIIRLVKYTAEFSAVLGASRSNLNTQRFIRLFSLSLLMLLIILPLQLFLYHKNIVTMLPIHPYSWAATHGSSLSRIDLVPSNGGLPFYRWIPLGFSVLIFIFFGLGRDAAMMYNNFVTYIGLDKLTVSLSSLKSASWSSSVSTGHSQGGAWYQNLWSKKSDGMGLRRVSKTDNFTPLQLSRVDTLMSGVLNGSAEDKSIEAKPPVRASIFGRRLHPDDDCNV